MVATGQFTEGHRRRGSEGRPGISGRLPEAAFEVPPPAGFGDFADLGYALGNSCCDGVPDDK